MLIDWRLQVGKLDGFETAIKINNDPRLKNLKIIMMTAYGCQIDNEKEKQSGIKVCLTKPIDSSTLQDGILEVFGKKETQNIDNASSTIDENVVLNGTRILVVEDNPTNQEMARAVLGKYDIEVVLANDGKEAVDLVNGSITKPFDAILMDIQMPVMDGFEATSIIRQIPGYSKGNIPIIAMTAHAMKGDDQKSIEAGMDTHLTKPIDRAKLFATLRELIDFSKVKEEDDKSADIEPEDITEQADEITLPDTLPGISIRDTINTLMLDDSIFHEVLIIFWETNINTEDKLKEAYTAKDWNKLREIAHSIKGSGANVGMNELSLIAADLENEARKAHDQTQSDMPYLYVEKTIVELNVVLNSLKSLR
jgi:two-component system sensor histidine kinase/response regulator